MGADLAVPRITDIHGVVVERRQRADHIHHHRHRVGIVVKVWKNRSSDSLIIV